MDMLKGILKSPYFVGAVCLGVGFLGGRLVYKGCPGTVAAPPAPPMPTAPDGVSR